MGPRRSASQPPPMRLSRVIVGICALVGAGLVYFVVSKHGVRDSAPGPSEVSSLLASHGGMEVREQQGPEVLWTDAEEIGASDKERGMQMAQGRAREDVKSVASPTPSNSDICPGGHKVVTVSTTHNNQLCSFLFTALWQGITPKVLGYGGPYRENIDKAFYMLEELARLPSDCVVTFTDVDVMFLSDAQVIVDKYRGLRSPKTLISAECKCSPWGVDKFNMPEVCREFPAAPTAYKYLNSGFIMGRAQDLLPLYRRIYEMDVEELIMPRSDQERLGRLLLKEPQYGIELDYYANITLSMTQPRITKLYNERCPTFSALRLDKESLAYVNTYTHNTPSILHFNGRGRLKMDRFWNEYVQQLHKALGPAHVQQKVNLLLDKEVELAYGKRQRYGDMCGNWVKSSVQGQSGVSPDHVPYYLGPDAYVGQPAGQAVPGR